MADNAFTWVDEVPALCLTFVAGMSPAEVESVLGGDPTTRRTAVLAITQGSPDWAAIFVWERARLSLRLLLVFAAAAYSACLLHRRLA